MNKSCYSESDAARTYHVDNAFVRDDVVRVMTFESLQLKPFCLEKSRERKGFEPQHEISNNVAF